MLPEMISKNTNFNRKGTEICVPMRILTTLGATSIDKIGEVRLSDEIGQGV